MKARKTLSLHREALADLRSDEMILVAGANTGLGCGEETPTCPVILSQGEDCETLKVLECFVTGKACS